MKAILQGQKVSGLPEGGTVGQVLTKTETGSSWQDSVKELPEGGSAGQILEKTAESVRWVNNDSITQSEADARYLKLSGGTMIGALTLNGNPTNNNHAASKNYVDQSIQTAILASWGASY